METEILKIDRENVDENILKHAAKIIQNGDLVAFPTETVYGLGADGLNPEASRKIFKAKNRPEDNPLILHIDEDYKLDELVEKVDERTKFLIKNLWPGPLTVILKKSSKIPDIITGGGDTVAVRRPKDKLAREFIKFCNRPIAAPSANISGRPSPTNAKDVFYDMDGRIPLIIDGGSSDIGIESTVIDMSLENPCILRPGYYTYEYIKKFIPNVCLDDSLVDDTKVPRSPGQKYKHYAPKAQMKVFVGEKSVEKINDLALKYKNEGKKVGILVFNKYTEKFSSYITLSLGDKENLIEMSHVLFEALRDLDRKGVDIILAQGVEEIGLGKSIMNRMKKSASGNIYNL
ncbi:L-threonylcarbamoyladenylate synthase [Anaerococcus hydrogenalis]|uniref:Threonylcarbamoyl-AMP synthase n=1 Tax=Anaerococcus hydrogenalis TaxID=33029 RepID=A0A2N6UJG8_9FIRM|nr:L-threonylcarbamoyladenylate synthase [Anaerococcus hydrogenalis]MDK7695132.1 L-threonylcarbamoyladenylate synthase [Anaerococcus hydrogenalis]MDK7696893.1 L-threonylcarbamoyladenylate synthase [Anaerococcus hydrogenalis]MDK7708159.1 L-threonylcarbamoyladenylate synthase [Anaerococcus hydrogenalis]PMC81889.1 threonylcarbamoyl-AMP synthase [Anaerococcus hydrogenalis]